MTNLYSLDLIKNIYKKPNFSSEITSQIIYGERYKILKKNKDWVKIKTSFDNYTGFINKNKHTKFFKPTHKCYKLKTRVFHKKKTKKKQEFLPFNSRIEIKKNKGGFAEFEKGKYVKINDLKKINFKEKNFFKILNKFTGCRYLWGGKTFKGIDCSALIQMFYFFNNRFFPRDTRDQIKVVHKKKSLKSFNRGDIIYWKGHVAVCIDKQKLIHAYGPKKKVLIMNIKNTIKRIEDTAHLKVKKISKI
tara:strand:- start:521 stop:1261 length:741 start_codon:yes stop_codon:yes gene_type:complete